MFEEKHPGHRFEGYSQIWGFGKAAGPLINTAFLLFSLQRHGALMRNVYVHCEDADVMHWGEMVPLSEEIHRAGLFHDMDPHLYADRSFLASLLSVYDQSKLRVMAAVSIIYRSLDDNCFLYFLDLSLFACASWPVPVGMGRRVFSRMCLRLWQQ